MNNKVLVETSARHVHLAQEHIDILFGEGITTPEILIEEFESIYRTFAYNHIALEDKGDSIMNGHQACDALFNLSMFIDGLKGKNLKN